MRRRRPVKNEPVKRTVEGGLRIVQWNSLGTSTCKPFIVSKRYRVKRLRGASVYVIGPGTWKGGRMIGNAYTVKNTDLMVRLSRLADGVTSKIWKPDMEFRIKPRFLTAAF